VAARRIRLEVEGVAAVAELTEALSPRTTEAFWQSLPIEAALTPAKWSGQACTIVPGGGPINDLDALENPVCSIYPGYLVARPLLVPGAGGGSLGAHLTAGLPHLTPLLIAYGPSEFRWHLGTDYVTRVAKIVENRAAFLAVLARTHDEGEKRIAINRLDHDGAG